MVSACVCPVRLYSVCVCVSTLVWHLYGSCQFPPYLRGRSAATRKQQKETSYWKFFFFFLLFSTERHFCSPPPPRRPTAYTAIRRVSRHDGYLRSGAPFISSEPGFASILAGVIFLARSFGNLSSMGWLARGLLFHAQHQPAALSSLSGASIWIKWLWIWMCRCHASRTHTHINHFGLLSPFRVQRCFNLEFRDD